MKRNLPLAVGLLLAVVLFVCNIFHVLSWMGIGTDNPWPGYDYFSLPRCGLAIRHGTNPFTSTADYPQYAPYATGWVSIPALCLFAGVPLSYLPPWVGYWVANSLYLFLHLWLLWTFGRLLRSSETASWKDATRDTLFFAAVGFFFPWYVMYHQAQYHALAVWALALVLVPSSHIVAGFVLSAMGKPLLAPAALVLAVRRRWRDILKISFWIVVTIVPWAIFRYDVSTGLRFERNPAFFQAIENASLITKMSVSDWNQELSLASALDPWLSFEVSYHLRLTLVVLTLLVSTILFYRKSFELAIITSTFWFFFLYARGHEYHSTLYVPILLYLYCRENGRYKNWWTVLISILLALPTTYALYKTVYAVPGPYDLPKSQLLAIDPLFYYLHVWLKPACAFLLFGTILWKERPYFRRAHSTSVPP